MVTSRRILIAVSSLVSVAFALDQGHHYGGGDQSGEHHVDYHAHPKYHYDYAVHDLHTGDVKNKWETRDGDVVKGYYSVNEPDGTIRKVEYTADKHNGFNAVVKRFGKSYHPQPVKHDHHYGGQNSFTGGNFGGEQSGSDFGNYGSGGHSTASSYSNANIYRLGLHGGFH